MVVLTPDGCQALEQFAARIPASMRKAIDAYLAANRAVLLENACIGADYRYLDKHQYLVELWAYEGEIEIIHLCLNVASGSQASQLCEGWYKNGGKCYDTILSTLLA